MMITGMMNCSCTKASLKPLVRLPSHSSRRVWHRHPAALQHDHRDKRPTTPPRCLKPVDGVVRLVSGSCASKS